MATAMAHPKVMTIQPEFSALEFLSSTPATTPSPRMIRIIVPINSPIYACIDHSPLERPSGRHVTRRTQVGLHLVIEFKERYGEPRHLQRGHVFPDVGHPPNLHSLALQHVGDVGVGYVELHQRRAAHAVDHYGHLRAGEVNGVAQDLLQHLIDNLVRRRDILALDAWLAVDADADLHLVIANIENGLPALGRGATREGHTHRAHVGVDAFGKLLYPCEVFAVVGRGTADLVHEDGASDTAPPARVRRVLDGHIVVGDDVVGLYSFGLAEFPCHLEVKHVARVVLDDVEDTGPAVHGLARFEHLVWGRARENGSGAGGVEHPWSHETAVGRLVARAAAGHEGYLALYGGVGPYDDVGLWDNPDQAAVGQLHPPEHVLDDPLGRVDDFLHLLFSSLSERGLDRFLCPLLGPCYGLFPPSVEPFSFLLVHLRLVAAPQPPPVLELLAVLPEPCRQASEVGCAEGRGLQGLRHLYGRPEYVGLELHHPAVGSGPAVGLEGRDVYPRVGLHRLDRVAGLVAHALKGGPREVRPAGATREPDDGAPGVRIPVWRPKANERRHEVHVVVRVEARCELFSLLCALDDPEPVPEPLHRSPRYEDGALQRVLDGFVAEAPRYRRQHLALTLYGFRACHHQGEGACSVGILGQALIERDLAEEGGLLVAGDPGDGDLGPEDLSVCVAVDVGARLYVRECRTRHSAQHLQQLVVPLEVEDVVHEGARSVRVVCDVGTASGQLVDHP